MAEVLFDLSAEYGQMLQQGLRLSGEDPNYFAEGRVASARARLNGTPIRRILDFGCGTGNAVPFLARYFGEAEIVGVDTSENALQHARGEHGSSRIHFAPLEDLKAHGHFDLCYVNGVFHHIDPEQRPSAIAAIREALAPGGRFALFENNPWNPGTRLVMSRIPFDRDAIPLSIGETKHLLASGGFSITDSWTLFYFPKSLAFLRFAEPTLSSLPLGAQYCVLGTRR